jgi:hypothetical protein
MIEEQVKINRLGKPIKRKSNGDFAIGNQEGKIFGKDHESKGRPKGSKNIMTLIKEVALRKPDKSGLSNIEIITAGLVHSAKRMEKIIEKMEDNDPRKFGYINRYGDLCAKIVENLSKFSGDYAQKFQAQLIEELSPDEKEIMQNIIKNAKK